MRITVPVQLGKAKAGAVIACPSLRLAACGPTADDARIKLEGGIKAWCSALRKLGCLEEALQRANLHMEDADIEGLQIMTTEIEHRDKPHGRKV